MTSHNPDVLACLANLSSDEVFTPPHLVNEILDLLPAGLWSDKETRFLDPACKSGVFLREIAKRLDSGLEQAFPDRQERMNHIFKNQVFGMAITELTSLLCRRSVYCSKTANGKYSVCEVFDEPEGNIRFTRVRHTWNEGRCSYCGASEVNYEREEGLETHAYEFIHEVTASEVLKMKFDVIIGNPPYQLSDAGYGTSAAPIYQLFVQQAKKLNPRYLSMIVPARWYSGGKGLDDFRNEMLHDDRLREIHDFPDATEVFPGVQIKGGVCYFLWKRDERGLCRVTSYGRDKTTSVAERPLLEEGCETFIRYNEGISILKKVQAKGEPSLAEQISARKPFGLPTTFKGKKKSSLGSIEVYQNGGVGYIGYSDVTSNPHLIGKWKVLIPPLGSGSDSFPHPILGQPFVVPPHSACTETYLVAGAYDNEQSAQNLAGYLQTRFLRFLVLLKKPTQHATSKVYGFVPKQDFSEAWDDARLYKKYGITQEEVAFIESMVRPMGAEDE